MDMSTVQASRYHAKPCLTCEKPFTPRGPRSRHCDDCRGEAPATPQGVHAPQLAIVPDDSAPNENSALDVIDAFGLDYNIGNAVRFLLERHDGDDLENLRAAQSYLERAIARLDRPAPAAT